MNLIGMQTKWDYRRQIYRRFEGSPKILDSVAKKNTLLEVRTLTVRLLTGYFIDKGSIKFKFMLYNMLHIR
jgi:hypothetical protein